jgi:hypothetical protein
MMLSLCGVQLSCERGWLTNDGWGNIDWEIVRDHDGDQQTAHLDTRYNLETHDGAVLYLRTTG